LRDKYQGTTFSRAEKAKDETTSTLPQAGAEPQGEATYKNSSAAKAEIFFAPLRHDFAALALRFCGSASG